MKEEQKSSLKNKLISITNDPCFVDNFLYLLNTYDIRLQEIMLEWDKTGTINLKKIPEIDFGYILNKEFNNLPISIIKANQILSAQNIEKSFNEYQQQPTIYWE